MPLMIDAYLEKLAAERGAAVLWESLPPGARAMVLGYVEKIAKVDAYSDASFSNTKNPDPTKVNVQAGGGYQILGGGKVIEKDKLSFPAHTSNRAETAMAIGTLRRVNDGEGGTLHIDNREAASHPKVVSLLAKKNMVSAPIGGGEQKARHNECDRMAAGAMRSAKPTEIPLNRMSDRGVAPKVKGLLKKLRPGK